VAYFWAQYEGLKSCRAAARISGGGKGCTWGCLGLGDCDRACDFDAIRMNKFGLPVGDEEKCVACNDCTGRSYARVTTCRIEDAHYVIVGQGSVVSTAEAVADY
jgi:ferredoxin